MNVKLIYSKNLSDPTGASTVMRIHAEQVDRYAKAGINFEVLARDTIYKKANTANSAQKPHFSYKKLITGSLERLSRKSATAAYLWTYIRSLRPAKKLNNLLRDYIEEDDVLFFNEFVMCYYYLKQYGKGNHKIVTMFHSDGEDFTAEKERTRGFEKTWVYRMYMRRQDLVISQTDRLGFVSRMAAERFKELHKEVDTDKVFYIQNGMQSYPQRDVPIHRPIEIVCVGTINPRKNQESIVRALIKCKDNGISLDHIHFTLVGGGEKLPLLMQLSDSYGLSKTVSFVGSSNEVDRYLREADIFILPSISEGLPMAILEAMRLSLPIVSTRVGGIPETIIDGESGLLIDSTADGVYQFITHINDYDWKKMGQKSYQLFQDRFTVEKMIESYISIFKSLS
ncbi:MAG: glycosyltransferase family 4 protein [Prevotella sp.]|nr:glycosyltransferase family 4 protein [Prevotella sp.]